MPTFRITVLIDVDDQPVTDFPLIRRIATTSEDATTYTQVTGGGSVGVPHGTLVTDQVLVLQTSQPVTMGIGGGSISLNSNAFVMVIDASVATAGLTLTNASGNTATVKTLMGGV